MTTPAEQVYYNLDLRSLILSYNRCARCNCYGYKNSTDNIKPRFFKIFMMFFAYNNGMSIIPFVKYA